MSRQKIDALGQRELALALRYHIDMAQIRGAQHRDIITRLIAANPTSFRSRHVQYNLGTIRRRWLADEGYAAMVPEPVEDHVA